MNDITFALILIAIGLFLFLTLDFRKDDCFPSHKLECEQAHSRNKTYLYCSGFEVESRDEDLNTFCAFHPNESCNNVPHGCVLQENENFRVCLRFTNLCLV